MFLFLRFCLGLNGFLIENVAIPGLKWILLFFFMKDALSSMLISCCLHSEISGTNQNVMQSETSPDVMCSQSASLRMFDAELHGVFFRLRARGLH